MNSSTKSRAQCGESGHSPDTDSAYQQHIQAVRRRLYRRRHPLAVSWLNAHPDDLPGAVSHDGINGRNTRNAAAELMPKLEGIEGHARQDGHGLIFVTVTDGPPKPVAVYDGTSAEWSRQRFARIAQGLPHFWTVEYAPDKGNHGHAIMSAAARAEALAQGAHVEDVYDLWGLARYLSKPKDARAARKNHQRMQDVEEHADAVSLYLTARAARFREARASGSTGRAYLPAMKGFVGMSLCAIRPKPKRKPKVPSHTAENTPALTAA